MFWNSHPADPDIRGIGWIVQTRDDMPPGGGWLTAAEKERLGKLRFLKRRADWRLGRWTAKRAVCAYLENDGVRGMGDVEVVADADGAPVVSVGGRSGVVAVSISHSGGVGLCAVAPPSTSIGCDVETVEGRDGTFVVDFFTAEEAAFVRSVEPSMWPLAATLIWSAKESALKVLKKGLSRDTRSVTARVGDPLLRANPVGWNRIEVECFEPAAGFRGWWRVDSGKVFTIVVDGAPTGFEPRRLI